MSYLEHANITVPDVEDAARFLQTLDPAFEIRHAGVGDDGLRWMHIGTQSSYFALRDVSPANKSEDRPTKRKKGSNHFGNWRPSDCSGSARAARSRGDHRRNPGNPRKGYDSRRPVPARHRQR